MPVEYEPDEKKKIDAAITAFWLDEYDEDIGLVKLDRQFRFFNNTIGARAYNQGLADAQALIGTRLLDMDVELRVESGADNPTSRRRTR